MNFGKRQNRRSIDVNTPDTKIPKTIKTSTVTPKTKDRIKPCKFKVSVI
jgi:hypothetical protein